MRLSRTAALTSIGILITLLCLLAIVVSINPLPMTDVSISRSLQAFGSTKTLEIMTLVSMPGNAIPAAVLGILAIVLLLLSPFRQAIIPLSFVLPADLLSFLLKDIVQRPRPSAALVQVHQVLTDPGFPSSHVVHYTVFFGFLAYLFLKSELLPKRLRRPLGGIALALVFLVPFSRMYLGAHWPTDVIGGYLLGLSVLVVQIKVFHRLGFKHG
ncbi:phosphatase PAP2 family protein [Candidatus Woesebacteria bacterium]|nr:phosphatase PAP2 family protein [Candidatus Woesebacteria bacterium]